MHALGFKPTKCQENCRVAEDRCYPGQDGDCGKEAHCLLLSLRATDVEEKQ